MTPDLQILVDPAWLEARLGDPKLCILDCTVYMTPQPVGASICRSGRPNWEAGHIPGSHYVSMVEDFADPGGNIAYRLPPHERTVEKLRSLGVDDDSTIVLYGADYIATVTRVFWVLRVSGARDVRILDGGWDRWVAEGKPVSRDAPPARRGSFTGGYRREYHALLDDVRAALDDPSVCLLNALAREQFLGTGGAHYGRPGRIPRSVNLPLRTLFDPDTKRFHAIPRLQALLAETGADKAPRILAYCGGGIAASGTFFVLALLGYDNVSMYDGSLLEWSRDPSLPMIVGEDRG
ncbi:MAG: sulfurtransferase [Alphaproteobacteria bacterium]|nr:sulfurtransferase [Alphaproteobacteria bacterium]